ncbi:ndufa2, NADH:ubiquinone oxidoreductase 10.5kD subunit [Irineochytrium annulatum]|nr:ndufa2, NADH:ubiquinone oxidoreductase 10.5kD subunit [Irineochytrium annulatum]
MPDFIKNHFSEMRKQNPTLPILVREAASVEARVFGRYDFGQERKISLQNLDESGVAKALQELAETSPSKAQ